MSETPGLKQSINRKDKIIPLESEEYEKQLESATRKDVTQMSAEIIRELTHNKNVWEHLGDGVKAGKNLAEYIFLHRTPSSKGYANRNIVNSGEQHAKFAMGTMAFSSFFSKDAISSLIETTGRMPTTPEGIAAAFAFYFLVQKAKQIIFDNVAYSPSELMPHTEYIEKTDSKGNKRVIEKKHNPKFKWFPWVGIGLSSLMGPISFYNATLGLNPNEKTLMYEFEKTEQSMQLRKDANDSTEDLRSLGELVDAQVKLEFENTNFEYQINKIEGDGKKIEEDSKKINQQLNKEKVESSGAKTDDKTNQQSNEEKIEALRAKIDKNNEVILQKKGQIQEIERKNGFFKYITAQRANEARFRLNENIIETTKGDPNDNRRNQAVLYNQGRYVDAKTATTSKEKPQYELNKEEARADITKAGGKFIPFGLPDTPAQVEYAKFQESLQTSAKLTLQSYIKKLEQDKDKDKYKEKVADLKETINKIENGEYYKKLVSGNRLVIGKLRTELEMEKYHLPLSYINAFLVVLMESLLVINSIRLLKNSDMNEKYMNRNLQDAARQHQDKLVEKIEGNIFSSSSVKAIIEKNPGREKDIKKFVRQKVTELSFEDALPSLMLVAEQIWAQDFGLIEKDKLEQIDQARSIHRKGEDIKVDNWRKTQEVKIEAQDEQIADDTSGRHSKYEQEKVKRQHEQERTKHSEQAQTEKEKLHKEMEVQKVQALKNQEKSEQDFKLSQQQEDKEVGEQLNEQVRRKALEVMYNPAAIQKLDPQMQQIVRNKIAEMTNLKQKEVQLKEENANQKPKKKFPFWGK